MATIADLAVLVRSKNAGPFWLTIDIMFDEEAKYRRVRDSEAINRAGIARMFRREPDDVIVVNHDAALAIKVSFPRPQSSVARSPGNAYIRHAMAFDTLSYARRLKEAGVPERQAEAMADATRELVVQDIANKADIAAVKAEIGALEQRIYAAMDTLALRLTVRMGVMLAAGLSLVVALIGLLVRLR